MERARVASGVLWDLDGTLIDSAGLHWLAWRDTLAAEGRGVAAEDFANAFGRRNDEILRGLYGADLAPEWISRISETKEQSYRRLLRERGLAPLPGAMAWLARLREAGYRQALASSAPRPNIEAVLGILELGKYLDAVVSADDVGRGKPDPAIFLAASDRLGLPAAHCVVVEDAPAGLEAARRAGMRSIGVLSDHHPRLSADLVVPSLEAIPADGFETLLRAVA